MRCKGKRATEIDRVFNYHYLTGKAGSRAVGGGEPSSAAAEEGAAAGLPTAAAPARRAQKTEGLLNAKCYLNGASVQSCSIAF